MEPTQPVIEDRLALGRLVRAASGLSAAAIVSPVLALPAGLVAARWLGPESFGRGQTVLLLYMLATLLRTGVFEGGVRAYVHRAGSGDMDGACRAQNVAFTLESLFSVIPGLVLAAGAFGVEDNIRATGLFLAPLAVLATSVSSYLSALHVARESFGTVARATLVRAFVAPATLLVATGLFGAVGIFVSPIIADLVTIVLLARARPGLGLQFRLDWRAARPLLQAGFPLGLGAVVYWAYRLVGSSAVALAKSAADYGLYSYAVVPATIMARAVASLHTALTPAVWTEMADKRRSGAWGRSAGMATVLLGILAGAATNLGQAVFGPAVQVVAPSFAGSVPVFEILALNVVLLSVAAVPSLVLDSTEVNRQVRHLGLWVGALAVNGLANAVVLAAGAGLLAIAVNDIWVQAGVITATYLLARPHLPSDWPERIVLAWLGVCIAATIAVAGLLTTIAPSPDDWASLLIACVCRLGIVCTTWGLVGLVFQRRRPRWSSSAATAPVRGTDGAA